MSVAIVTGAAGLIGSETVAFFAELGMDVVGVDNDMRSYYFGPEASTAWNRERLVGLFPHYEHHDVDVRDRAKLAEIFRHHGRAVSLVIHAAAQPSQQPVHGGPIDIVDQLLHGAPGQVVIAQDAGRRRGGVADRVVLVEDEDHVGGILHQRPEVPFGGMPVDLLGQADAFQRQGGLGGQRVGRGHRIAAGAHGGHVRAIAGRDLGVGGDVLGARGGGRRRLEDRGSVGHDPTRWGGARLGAVFGGASGHHQRNPCQRRHHLGER